ncbi:iron-sulfur cluster assembly protein [Marinobacter fuscus]|uniref:iron-sulfur cluster assembly protein n=1 Tax=Marinobacter fuscus TaxID=2109942 RepID=UPI001F0BB47A|nr:iron-sulfur cluster assembly protein [Marinobacter fuscus]
MNLLARQNVPGMAARVFVDKGGTSQAETCLAYCPPGEEKASDARAEFGDLVLYIDALSAPYLQDMKIDVDRHGSGQMLAIKAPNSKKPARPPETFELPDTCVGLHVPHGTPVSLPAGATVSITQALGGSFTINYNGNLYRLAPDVARGIGLFSDVPVFETPADGQISKAQCEDALRQVYDPEIPVNVLSLGLIYGLDIDQESGKVCVTMTLTSPTCGMGDVIAADVRDNVSQVPLVKECQVEIVFDPPWSYDNLDDDARLELGLI